MNRHLHRIVFNAARGQRMVVAETAPSHSSHGASPGPRSRNWKAPLARTSLAAAVLTGLSLALLAPLSAQAQIRADKSAPANQQPILLQTANGVPLVNIRTPSAAGVSRNSFSQFDVQNNGAILNNVRSNAARTQIGGWVQANPFLNGGVARVIINEVNSSNPSYLKGPVEVAGQRAEVIIANPSGIRVNGGSFINAAGVTLTTGTPVMNNGNLESFRVQQGMVHVEGLGLETGTADYTRILARAMEVNAGLWAKNLTVVTGANDVKALASGADATANKIAGTGAAPNYMLDVAAIGGMYSGHIYLVGTEAGLGVNNRGTIAAQEGHWVLRADGWLVNAGTVYAKGNTTVAVTGDVSNTGTALIGSQQNTSITAGNVTTAGTAVLAAGLAADGSLGSSGDLSVTATRQAAIHGKTLAAGDLSVQGSSLDLSSIKASAGNVALVASAGSLDLRSATVATSGLLSVQSNAALTTDDAQMQAGHLTLTATSLSNVGGELGQSGTGTMSITTSGVLDNTDGVIAGNGPLDLSTGRLTNLRGSIQATGNASVDTHGGAFDNTAGRLTSQAALDLTTGDLTNDVAAGKAGLIGSTGGLTLTAGAVHNRGDATAQSVLWSGQTLTMDAASLVNAGSVSARVLDIHQVGELTNEASGSLESANDLGITATGAFTNAGSVIANTTLTIHAKDMANSGTLAATNQRLTAEGTFTNAAAAEVTAARNLIITAETVNNQGVINANEAAGASELLIRATTVNNTGTGALLGDHVAIAATTLNNRPEAGHAAAPVIAARSRLDLGVQTLNNEDGALIYSGGSIAIGGSLDVSKVATGTSLAINNLSATIEADTDLSIQTASLRNERRGVNVQQVTSIDETVEMQLASWQGNSHQERPITAGHFNYRAWQAYYLDPASSVFDAGNYIARRSTQEIGSSIQTRGDLLLSSGNNLTARAANVNAAGALAVQAGNDITLEAGRSTLDTGMGTHSSSSGFLSKKSSTTRETSSSDTAVGSSFGGNTVHMTAGNDLTLKGSAVISDSGSTLTAGNNVAIASDENRFSSTFSSETKKSGVFSGAHPAATACRRLGRSRSTQSEHPIAAVHWRDEASARASVVQTSGVR